MLNLLPVTIAVAFALVVALPRATSKPLPVTDKLHLPIIVTLPAPEAALALKITGKDLLKLGIIDEVLPEPSGGNNWAPLDAGNTLKEAIEKHLNALLQMPEEELIEERYKKFRVLGKFIEANNIEEIYSEIPQKTE